jgi:hypothetical protein
MKPPKYAFLTSKSGRVVAMRLDGKHYYRDAGCWQVKWEERDGKIVAVGGAKTAPTHHLDGYEFVEITRKEWAEDNRGYVKETEDA